MRWLRAAAPAWAIAAWLTGCAHTASSEYLDRAAWEWEVARRGVDVAAAVFPFRTTPEMERWVEEALSSRVGDDV